MNNIALRTVRGTSARTSAGLLAAAALLMVAAPAANAEPSVRPSASTGLAAGESITVELDGLPPNLANVAVGQCKPTIVAPTDCNLAGSLLGTVDDKGVWQPNGGKRTLVLVAALGATDCTTAAGACTISVTSLMNPSQILASAPLRFGAEPTPAPTTVAAPADGDDSNTALIAGAIITVVIVAGLVIVALLRRRGRPD
ncbi:neocarzinostatin apoprotein domain-containing protein [Nocardia fluminea]|uniref:neocarzinostatin apoprotein domain-containing protein n=1 Tax=Nocardia fluminea TaxID=134984 RepID=UPI0036709040